MIEQELRAGLLADATIGSLIPANAVYPHHLPQSAPRPCVVYQFHDGYQPLIHGGKHANKMYTVTLRVFAEDYGTCRLVTRAVIDYIHGLNATLTSDTVVSAKVHNAFADYEDTLELYTTTIDTTLHAREA